MKKILLLFISLVVVFADYEYSLQDYNSTSETFGMDVWDPEYSDYITLHYFSSQGWAGWTSTFGQLSNFQDELREVNGYENTVIIAVGQSNISSFNNSFCANSNLPLVQDQFPSLPVRAMFNADGVGYHKQVVILDYDRNIVGQITLNSGLSNSAKTYIRGIIGANYQQSIYGCTDDTATNYNPDATDDDGLCTYLGDVNGDTVVNVQDIIILVNMILNGETDDSADLNSDGVINILDVVQVVNIILS